MTNLNINRVLIFDDAANKANGGDADYVLGQSNFTDSTEATTQNRLNFTSTHNAGLAVDSLNNFLVIGDCGNHRVMVFQAPGALGFIKFFPFVLR